MLSDSGKTGLPDDWLALSENERAEIKRRADDTAIIDHAPSALEPPSPAPSVSIDDVQVEFTQLPALADVVVAAESLKPNDRMRLIARLWESLPPRNRAQIMVVGLENIKYIPDESEGLPEPSDQQPADSIWPAVRAFLFDPARTSGLYSAPRRFDLATIFVVTAAYSILFGAMSVLSFYFGPVSKVAVGTLVTVVAVVQAFYKDIANPRGVSVVTGAIAQTIIVVVIKSASRQLIPEPLVIAVILYGVLGGMVSGYLAGVLVGGVFLVADLLRKKFSRESIDVQDDGSNACPISDERGDSPWTN